MDQSHSGEYTCTPFNDLGSSGESAPMRVIVQQPPIFSVRPASLYVRRIGNNVKMHCAAEPETYSNQNPLVVTWFKVKSQHQLERVKIKYISTERWQRTSTGSLRFGKWKSDHQGAAARRLGNLHLHGGQRGG